MVLDGSGSTLLHLGVEGGCLPLVEFLLDHGEEINTHNKDGQTPLHRSATNWGMFDMAQLLLSRGAYINAKDKNERTVLHLAAEKGQLELLKLFLNNNQDLNARDSMGLTPLHWSSRSNAREKMLVLEYLLQLHAVEPNATSKTGQTALHYLMDWPDHEIYRTIDDEKVRITELLVKHGVAIDVQDEKGETALHIAVRNPRKCSDALVKLLVKMGANLTLTDKNGKTVYEVAGANSRSESVAMLLLSDVSGRWPHQCPASANSSEMLPRKRPRVE
jgi:ankyrin repeat protein